MTEAEELELLELENENTALGAPSVGGQAGGMGDVKMSESQAGTGLNNLFPSAEEEYNARMTRPSGSAWQTVKDIGVVGLAGVNDAASLMQRGAAAAFTDQTMNTPGAHAFKDQTDRAVEGYKKDRGSYDPTRLGGPGPGGEFLIETAGRMADDPAMFLGAGVKALGAIPKAISGAGKAMGGLNKAAGFTAAKASGVPEEALRAAGSKYGRARMEKNFGKEKEIGDALLTKIDNADDYMPERQTVDRALEEMEDLPVGPAIDAMQAAKGPVREGGRLSPESAAANVSVDKYINFLRGGDLPPDLAQAAQEAGRAAQGAKAESAAKGSAAAVEAKAASQAERQAATAQSKAGKAAAGVGKAKKDAEGLLHKWDREDAQKALKASIQESRDAAAQSREAAINARARVAVGEVTEQEAKAAEAAADAAERGAHAAEVAARIKGGEKLVAISKDLAARGLPRDALRDALKSGKTRAESIKELPPQSVSAKGYRDLRRDLDVPVDWDAEGAQIKNNALKAGRTTMKNKLLEAAEASGNPEYAEAMKSWSDKLDKLERVKDLLGKTGTARDKRVEQFISNLFGKNNKYKTELMADIDKIFGGNTISRAKAADNAKKFGESGKPGLLPVYGTGGSVSAAVNMGLVLPRAAAAVGTLGTASPLIASRITLPMLTAMEKRLKSAGVALTPRAASVMAAMKKPASEAQRARMATILAAELEAQAPANAIPFRVKDAAGLDKDKDERRAAR